VTKRRDPIDRLRGANPLPEEQAPGPDTPGARALFDRIVQSPAGNGLDEVARRRTLRRKALILVPAAALVAVAAGFAISRAVRQPLIVACYERATLHAPREVIAPTGTPVQSCRALWGPGAEFNPAGSVRTPPLVACVLGSGAVGVFPDTLRPDTCSALGLGGPPRSSEQAPRILQLERSLATRFLSSCVGRGSAVRYAEAALRRSGLVGWRVLTPAPFTSAEPCASAAVEVPGRTVSLIPVGNPSSS
jgi:hypothetical protein